MPVNQADSRGSRCIHRKPTKGVALIIAIIVGVCIVLAVLAFLLPRLSRYPQRGVDTTLSVPQRAASRLPGKLGEWAQKPFGTSRRAADKSAAKGREGRAKLPG